jgi:hypothetical protein
MQALRKAIHQYLDKVDAFNNGVATGKLKPMARDGTQIKGRLVWKPEYALQVTAEKRELKNSFLDSRAFGRVLAWMDESAESIHTAIDLLEWLSWVNKEWRRIRASAPGKIDPPPGVLMTFYMEEEQSAEALKLLAQARKLMNSRFHRQADQLINALSQYKPDPDPAYLYNRKFHAKRGAASNQISAFRGGVVRELDKRLPPTVDKRFATIAALLT